jgi:hypothetical protein
MSNENSQNFDEPLADFSMSMSDREVLGLILLTMRELRGYMVRTVGSADLLAMAIDPADQTKFTDIPSIVERLSSNARIVKTALDHIHQHLEERLSDK